jgi:hypothetical protein
MSIWSELEISLTMSVNSGMSPRKAVQEEFGKGECIITDYFQQSKANNVVDIAFRALVDCNYFELVGPLKALRDLFQDNTTYYNINIETRI